MSGQSRIVELEQALAELPMFDAHTHLVEGGALYVVIQKKQGAPSAKKLLEEVFGRVDTIARDKGYLIFRAIRT